MPVPLLPSDVLPLILQHTKATTDLLSLSLVSSSFRHEAQRILFRHVGPIKTAAGNTRTTAPLDTIIASPDRLALAVYSWNQEIVFPDNCPEEDKLDLILKTKTVLALMINLKNLRICTRNVLTVQDRLPNALWPLPNILRDCKFQLDRFEWDVNHGDGELLLLDFLPSQTTIKELELPFYRSVGTTGEDLKLHQVAQALGLSLKAYAGPMVLTPSFLAHQCSPATTSEGIQSAQATLRHLRWTDHPTAGSDTNLESVKDALKNVRLLHYDYSFISHGPSLTDVAASVPSVKVLRIDVKSVDYIDNDGFFDSISSFDRARVLVIRSRGYEGKGSLRPFAGDLFRSCGGLALVECADTYQTSQLNSMFHYDISRKAGYSWAKRDEYARGY